MEGVVGNYRLVRELGSGGFGAVFEARRVADDAPAAVKVLHADLVRTADAVERFTREVEASKRLETAGAVQVYEIGRLDDGRPYYAMELLEGEDLGERIRRVGALSPAQARVVLAAVGNSLAEAHRLGIVHRDVKASNVFLCEGGRIVLLDFGIAKMAADAGPALTSSWQILGTPAYRAPEQVVGYADERSDIYALGGLIYHMLTGSPPFSGSSATMVQHLHRYAERPRPSSVNPSATPYDEVIARAMATDPSRRYQSVAELVAAYDRIGGAAAEAEEGRAVVVRVTCSTASGAEASGEYLDALEHIWQAARRWYGDDGFQPVLEGSETLVFAREVAGDEEREVVELARETAEELSLGAEDRAVRVAVDVASGGAAIEQGAVVGGAIMQLGEW